MKSIGAKETENLTQNGNRLCSPRPSMSFPRSHTDALMSLMLSFINRTFCPFREQRYKAARAHRRSSSHALASHPFNLSPSIFHAAQCHVPRTCPGPRPRGTFNRKSVQWYHHTHALVSGYLTASGTVVQTVVGRDVEGASA